MVMERMEVHSLLLVLMEGMVVTAIQVTDFVVLMEPQEGMAIGTGFVANGGNGAGSQVAVV